MALKVNETRKIDVLKRQIERRGLIIEQINEEKEKNAIHSKRLMTRNLLNLIKRSTNLRSESNYPKRNCRRNKKSMRWP